MTLAEKRGFFIDYLWFVLKNSFNHILFLFLFISFYGSAQGPERRFRTILSAGIAGCQVDGDTYAGYNKLGPYTGVYVNRPLNEKYELEFGITYIQKGAKKNADPIQGDYSYYILRLNYAEVPFLFKMNYKKFKAEVGLSYAYLFSGHEENYTGYYNDKKMRDTDIGYNIGGAYKLTDKLLVNMRFNYSLVPVRPLPSNGQFVGTFWTRVLNKGLYNNDIVVSINYILQGKEK